MSHPAFPDTGQPTSLHATVNRWIGHQFADSTLGSYTSKLRKFVLFLHLHLLLVVTNTRKVLIPTVTPTLVCFYIAWLVMDQSFNNYDSIMGYVSALASWCKVRGRPDPRQHVTLGGTHGGFFALCRGLKRQLGATRPTRYPITEWHLWKLTAAAWTLLPPQQCLNFIAAIRLAFSALLRVGEFTTKGALDPLVNPQRRDVKFFPSLEEPQYCTVMIKQSKIDIFRSTTVLRIDRADDTDRCPVLALQRLYQQDPQPPTASLFNFRHDAHRATPTASPAPRSQFVHLCNELFAYARVPSMYLKTHSFRQGGATALLAAGAPEWIIKTMGRWRSDSWQIYAFTDPRALSFWSTAMNGQSNTPVDYDRRPPKRIMDYN